MNQLYSPCPLAACARAREALKLYAGIHPIHYAFHRVLSQRFPYAIYYDVTDNIVRVAAILDMRRNPLWIRKELGDRPHR